jgi:alkyl sulfatase BDS1-like metallo-beta-lactamase superfamily hydrolase
MKLRDLEAIIAIFAILAVAPASAQSAPEHFDPTGFLEEAVSENAYAGNAMSRRLFYQYGVLLKRSPYGHVDQSIGKNTAAGNLGLIAPNIVIEKDTEELTVGGSDRRPVMFPRFIRF